MHTNSDFCIYLISVLPATTNRTANKDQRTGEGDHADESQTFRDNSVSQVRLPEGEKRISSRLRVQNQHTSEES